MPSQGKIINPLNSTSNRDSLEASNQESLKALHEEKIRTQTERADYMTRKLAFITVLFGLSSMNLGIPIADLCWLLFFVPLVAI